MVNPKWMRCQRAGSLNEVSIYYALRKKTPAIPANVGPAGDVNSDVGKAPKFQSGDLNIVRYPVCMLAPCHPSNDGIAFSVPSEHRTPTGIQDFPIRDKSRIREIFAKVLETICATSLLQTCRDARLQLVKRFSSATSRR